MESSTSQAGCSEEETAIANWLLQQPESRLMQVLEKIQAILETRKGAVKRVRAKVRLEDDDDDMEVESQKGDQSKKAEKRKDQVPEDSLRKKKRQGESQNVRSVVEVDGRQIKLNQPEEKTEEPMKPKRPPPILVTSGGTFNNIKDLMKQAQIIPWEMKMVKEGIKIFTNNEKDFRNLVKIFNGFDIKHHSWQLPSEKELKVVVRGVHPEVAEEEILEELKEKGFAINSVKRMGNRQGKLPMVLVNAEKSEKSKELFDITHLGYLKVTTEPKRRPTRGQQCYRCQKFGHVQYRCTADEVCVRCAEKHPSKDCPRKDKTKFKAKCVNCHGDHPASSVMCPKNPVNQIKERQNRKSFAAAEVREGISYSQKMGKSTQEKVMGEQIESLSKEVSRMKEMLETIVKKING